MPCNSDYMEANGKEKELSRVACLLDELKGMSINKSFWNGYHPAVYNRGLSNEDANKLVSKLCSKLQNVDDVTKYSLEMQIWWRDHQEADKKRLEKEIRAKEVEAEKQQALDKLSDYERELLGLD